MRFLIIQKGNEYSRHNICLAEGDDGEYITEYIDEFEPAIEDFSAPQYEGCFVVDKSTMGKASSLGLRELDIYPDPDFEEGDVPDEVELMRGKVEGSGNTFVAFEQNEDGGTTIPTYVRVLGQLGARTGRVHNGTLIWESR